MIKKCFLACIALTLSMSAFAQNSPEMILVEGGTFAMGNDFAKSYGATVGDESPQHNVTLKSFYISKTEVTFDLFDLFCNTTGYKKPSDGGFGRGQLPVCNVSWESATMFCNWLSMRDGYDKVYNITIDSTSFAISINNDANGYRLPTEAEWEYAARGGSKSKTFAYSGSNDYNEVAWCRINAEKPQPVGSKAENEIGLQDMNGNVWEWCWDFYGKDYYKSSPTTDPAGPDKGVERVFRGGYWKSPLDQLRMTSRWHMAQNKESGMVGIRLVRHE